MDTQNLSHGLRARGNLQFRLAIWRFWTLPCVAAGYMLESFVRIASMLELLALHELP